MAAFDQLLGVLHIDGLALALDVGAVVAAHTGAFVVVQAGLGQSAEDHIHSALHQPLLVGVLDAHDELAALALGDEIGIQRGAQVADVHIPRGTGGKTGDNSVCHVF